METNNKPQSALQLLVQKIKAHNDSMNAVYSALAPVKSSPAADAMLANAVEEGKFISKDGAIYLTDEKPEPPKKLSFKEFVAWKKLQDAIKAKAKQNAELEAESDEFIPLDATPETGAATSIKETIPVAAGKVESFSLNIVLNEKQKAAAELAYQGKSFVLTGAAGSGKTTTQRAVAEALYRSGKLKECHFKGYTATKEKIRVYGPSIAFCAYTRRAAFNLQKAIFKSEEMAKVFANNVMTVHLLLEYEPETYYDPLAQKEKMRFIPKRTANNPLEITHLVIEESSMLSIDLWEKLFDALPTGVQIIFIGDINQLQPPFGPSILNYALIQLPVIELTEVYRNQGIVLENAHHILKGESIVESKDYVIVRGKQPVQQPQSKVAPAIARTLEMMMDTIGDDGYPEYDPDDCILLTPYNVQDCGSDSLNNHIAQFMGARRKAVVYEIIAGIHKRYLAVGDKVMFNRRDGVIVDIYRNASYSGKVTQLAGSDLTRFGGRIVGAADVQEMLEAEVHSNEKMLTQDYSAFDLESEEIERKQQASHIVVVQYEDESKEEISSAGDFSTNNLSLGYALTVHKAQGSEWRKVFIVLHRDQAVALHRELLYTAATRARTKVVIFAKDAIIQKAINNPRIKGNTLAAKIEYFNAKIDLTRAVQCTK